MRQVKLLRVADAAADAAFLGEEAGERTKRQKTPVAEVKVCSVKPITAARFNALREMLASRALAAEVRAAAHQIPFRHCPLPLPRPRPCPAPSLALP